MKYQSPSLISENKNRWYLNVLFSLDVDKYLKFNHASQSNKIFGKN